MFRPHQGGALLLGAVGQLQLEVVAHRLEARVRRAGAHGADALQARALGHVRRRAAELERFIEANAHRIAYDVVDAPTFLSTHASELTAAQENWPKIRFHALREHGGLVVHSNRLAA